ncbi:MAG TPA: hypothetical protein VKH41_04595 [Myxococcota bacterium]|nr:hypothetical protein [Myxococcota bacterium]
MIARRAWHLAALLAFALAAAVHTRAWFTEERMPAGDFPGYAAQVQYVRDALLEHGRVPHWCIECYGGTTNFTANLKEYLAFPLALVFEPVVATKLLFVLLRVVGAFGLYWLAARELAAPAAGIAAGYAYSYGAIANHEIEHLDVAVATAIAPFIWIAAVGLWRRGDKRYAVALGVLMAAQLANNWVHAATAPLAVLGLALVRPWWVDGGEPAPWCSAALARRWAVRGLAAFGVFCAFAASSTVWLASDARNHALFPAETIQRHRAYFVERSPFLFANRGDALAPWLSGHQPPYELPIADGGKRYLGGVVAAVILVGVAALRRAPVPRRWAALAAAAVLLQYWLALGPRTLLWEVATSLHWSREAYARAEWALRAAAALCLPAGVALVAWARSDPARPAQRTRGARLLAASLLLFFPTTSLWNACARLVPAFAIQRSPGHFFDTGPFALSLLFAACLTALARRVPRPALAHALVAAVGIALVLDYQPSRRSFSEGSSLARLRTIADLVADLPGDGGTLRIGLGPDSEYSALASWLIAQSRAGHASGWISWQAGTHWRDSYGMAAFGSSAAEPDGPRWSERYAPLLGAARIRDLLLLASEPAPPAPWRLARDGGGMQLWEAPGVSPIAVGYRAWKAWDGARGGGESAAAADALRANALLVAPPDDRAAEESGADPARAPAEPLIAVDYQRPEPERIQLWLDAGTAPALVFVSEGYHPWWRAQVDDRPAPVMRASVAHMAVPVGPGRHAVELRLVRPAAVAASDWITSTAWLALVVGAPIAWIRRTVWR